LANSGESEEKGTGLLRLGLGQVPTRHYKGMEKAELA
jgi:hypothetical protein